MAPISQTDQVITALLAKGYVWAERQKPFTVYIRHRDNTVVGLETFDDGGCLLWRLLTPRDDVEAIIAAIP
jgi:hypothetical protein